MLESVGRLLTRGCVLMPALAGARECVMNKAPQRPRRGQARRASVPGASTCPPGHLWANTTNGGLLKLERQGDRKLPATGPRRRQGALTVPNKPAHLGLDRDPKR